MPAAGVAYLLDKDGHSCEGEDPSGSEEPLDVPLAASGGKAKDQPFLAAAGHPAFGKLDPAGPGSPTFLAPAAGFARALDVVFPEHQRGNDYVSAWRPEPGDRKSVA